MSVLLLEKEDCVGGATTSQKVFPDYEAYLSRYSYLVSLVPEKIIHDLDLDLELRRRKVASFTPYRRNGQHDGLLLSNISDELSRRSLFELTGSHTEFEQLQKFYRLSQVFAEQVWDTMLEPLAPRAEFKRRFEIDDLHRESWRSLVEEPLGRVVERYLQDDLVRGVVFTDGKIGVFTHPHDETLLQNRCFLYHLIGNKTGEWKVPVGGMGNVVRQLVHAACSNGAAVQTNANVTKLDVSGKIRRVEFLHHGKKHEVEARFVLVNAGLNVLARLVGEEYQPDATNEGSVFKINMLLRRLPKLKAARYPIREAFCGKFHIDEGYEEMKSSYEQAKRGELPGKLPGEIYCHTLTDDSILAPELRGQGFQTLTFFGLDTPFGLFDGKRNEETRRRTQERFIAGLNEWLAEPLEDCFAIAADGSPCIESKSPVDIEEALGLYHGNIFQTALTFPFAETAEEAGTWGVETKWENVFLCGSSAQRGGAVSGIPGHNAAMKVFDVMGF